MSECLELDGLGARAGSRVLLEGVSFALTRGETLAIVGPNGAGKTTLLECVVGLRPHAGIVRYAGAVWSAFAERAERVAYMPDELRLPDEVDARSALLIVPRGKVGLWSKADSQVLFDDFLLEAL